MRTLLLAIALAAAATALGACGDDETAASSTTTPTTATTSSLDQAADAAGCELMLDLPEEGNLHLGPRDRPPDYGTNPPTSGDHLAIPAADGAYRKTPPPEAVVHSLEHGRIAVQYQPSLPSEDQLAIRGLFDIDPTGLLLFPNPEMLYEIAAAAWTNLIGCERYSERALRAVAAFRDAFVGRGPEAAPL